MDFSPIIQNYNEANIPIFSTINDRNNLPIFQRKDNMIVLVEDNGSGLIEEYQLVLGHYDFDLANNANWVETKIFSIPIYFDTQSINTILIPSLEGIIEIYENINNSGLYSMLPYNSGDYSIEFNSNLFLIILPRIMNGFIKVRKI